MNFEYDKLCEIDSDIERTNAILHELLEEVRALRKAPPFVPSVLEIVPARIPPGAMLAMSLPPEITTSDIERIRAELKDYLGDRKVLLFRAGDVKLGFIAFEDMPDA